MKKTYDVAVIGLGAMGSAAMYHLSKQGLAVVGLDQYHPPHNLGSTHGDTRITRLAIGEGSEYVPLVKRSHQLWRDLEKETGENLFVSSGGLVLANKGNAFLQQTIASAREYGIKHEILSAAAVKKEYPMFDIADDTSAFYEASAGYLFPEKIVAAHLRLAGENGATLLFESTVQKIDPEKKTIKTSEGQFRAEKIIIAAGAWTGEILPETKALLRIYRQLLYWFPIEKGYNEFSAMPVFIWEFGGSADDFIYGFPAIDGRAGGIKVATEEYANEVSPNMGKKPATEEEVKTMHKEYIKDNLPWLGGKAIRTASCLYSNTEDGRFLIDELREGVFFVSACSGHGFKHSAAIGEAISEKVLDGQSKISLDSFSRRA
jgi:sarcosine oxidase